MKREDVNFKAQLLNHKDLRKIYEKIKEKANIEILSPPTEQTLLVPVKDPISGGSFYAGEVLVTSCLVKVENTQGWSMVIDKNEKISFYIAVLDACFESGLYKDEITNLLLNAQKTAENKNKKINKKINSTRVSFDLMSE